MKKLISVGTLMLVILMGVLMSGCGENKLSAELEARIKQDYLQEFGYEFYFGKEYLNKFYGLYNESAVFFIPGEDEAIKIVTISGVEFSYNHGWRIIVWKDGIFYNLENDLESILSSGILTQINVKQIGKIHANNKN